MQDLDRIIRAIEFVTIAHNGQIRKTNGIPKIVHPYGVATIIARFGYNDDLFIAGLCHDVVEDCHGYTIEIIRKIFGPKVAQCVLDVSEQDKSLDWKTRKLIHIEHIKIAIFDSKVLCAADKIHNLFSLEADLKKQGEEVWKKFNASKSEIQWYYSTICESIVSGYESENIPIFVELKSIVNRVIIRGK